MILDGPIRLVLLAINFALKILYGIHLVSYYIGKCIYLGFLQCWDFIIIISSYVKVFFEELGSFLAEQLSEIYYFFTCVEYSVVGTLNAVSCAIVNCKNKTQDAVFGIFNIITEIIRMVSQAVLLIGDTFLLLPITIFSTLDALLVWSVQAVSNVLHNIIHDFLRYSIGMCSIFLLLKFRTAIYKYFKTIFARIMIKICGATRDIFKFNTKINFKPLRNEPIDLRSMCVICHDQPKRVLLLPCKHLCMCDSCSEQYGGSICPLCRSIITKKISVFL